MALSELKPYSHREPSLIHNACGFASVPDIADARQGGGPLHRSSRISVSGERRE